MTIRRVLAQSTVTELEPAVQWYSLLFDAEPDARPMEGLVEWHLGQAFGVQVWLEPDRAGHSSMVLDESDLDALADRLTAAGLLPPAYTVEIRPVIRIEGYDPQ